MKILKISAGYVDNRGDFFLRKRIPQNFTNQNDRESIDRDSWQRLSHNEKRRGGQSAACSSDRINFQLAITSIFAASCVQGAIAPRAGATFEFSVLLEFRFRVRSQISLPLAAVSNDEGRGWTSGARRSDEFRIESAGDPTICQIYARFAVSSM